MDVCYARDAANLERLTAALRALGARLRGAPEDAPFRLDAETLRAGDRFTFSTGLGPLDCLGTRAGTEGFRDLDASATTEDLDGVPARVASLDDLIRMKRAAGRPQDRIAIEWLAALRDELVGGGPQDVLIDRGPDHASVSSTARYVRAREHPTYISLVKVSSANRFTSQSTTAFASRPLNR